MYSARTLRTSSPSNSFTVNLGAASEGDEISEPEFTESLLLRQRIIAKLEPPLVNVQQRKVVVPNPDDTAETISLVTMDGTDAVAASSVTLSDAISLQGKTRRKSPTPINGSFWTFFRGAPPAARTISLNDNIDNVRRRQKASKFPPNMIRNQKYSIFTFGPVVLYNQVSLTVGYLPLTFDDFSSSTFTTFTFWPSVFRNFSPVFESTMSLPMLLH